MRVFYKYPNDKIVFSPGACIWLIRELPVMPELLPAYFSNYDKDA